MAVNWTGKWKGGRTYELGDGSTAWTIRRMVKGTNYQITLDVKTEEDALAELTVFERDPEAYRTKGQEQAAKVEAKAVGAAAAVYLDKTTSAAFLLHLKDEKELSDPYRGDAQRYLAAWATELKGKDFRGLTHKGLKKFLAKQGQGRRKWLITVFKSFCAFLEWRGDLDPQESPTRFVSLETVKGKADPEDRYYSVEQVEWWYRKLPTQALRDLYRLRVMAGMHGSEVDRIARGRCKVRLVDANPHIKAVVAFPHKTGAFHYVSLSTDSLAAVERLQARGSSPNRHSAYDAVQVIVKREKLKGAAAEMLFGNLRHTFITWAGRCKDWAAVEGNNLARAAAAAGHTNLETTKRHYVGDYTPEMPLLGFKLAHVDDPGSTAKPAKVVKLKSR